MNLSEKDRMTLRDLAKKLAEIAALPIQREKAELWLRLNRLERVRPMVFLVNDTWHETAYQIKLETTDDFARGQEWSFRTQLYHWEHIPDDHVYEARIYTPIVVRTTGMGIDVNTTRPEHAFGAAKYNPILSDNADPEMITMPTVTVDWEETERIYQLYYELYEGILAVEKCGIGTLGFTPMDQFIQWRGIQNTFTDMIDRPGWVHAWMERMTLWHLSCLDQYEKLNVLSLANNGNRMVGSGGLGFIDELPQPDFDGKHVRTIDMWGHATTQIFSEVSPAMHNEFALSYEKRFLSRFGLASYGCCEPLDRKLDIVKTIPNLRRVSMSPWVDVARGAEGLGNKYVFSYRPNPAIIGTENWDIEFLRNQLRDALEKTKDCVVEIIMVALHNCHNEPWRMWEWAKMAMQLAEEYA